MPQAFINRDGTSSIRELAKKMCVLVSTFGPIIERNYGDNELAAQALQWARTACTIVPVLDQLQVTFEPPNDAVVDPGDSLGINPDAHAPGPLPEPE